MSEGFKPILIAGADYSAAHKQPNPTWLALFEVLAASGAKAKPSSAPSRIKKGTVQEKRNNFLHLRLVSLENTGSDRLFHALMETRPLITGLDFPFGYPVPFLDWIRRKVGEGGHADKIGNAWEGGNDDKIGNAWQGGNDDKSRNPGAGGNNGERQPGFISSHDWQLTRELASMAFSELESAVVEFARETKPEPLRLTDQLVSPKGTSPLHRINPGLLKMTWQGAGLLLDLKAAGFSIAPFDDELSSGPETKPKVLEIYPTALLKWLSLPHRRYKGAGATAMETRKELITALARSSGTVLPAAKLHTVNSCRPLELKLDIKPSLRQQCLADDNALDGVIAAIGAAISLIDPRAVSPASLEASPELSHQCHLVPREGWIYTPCLLKP
ncbi:MAG: DUF429 domain-containing protein [Candidatus Obscuribacter sp.]|nr:DUF429 domain-containing protein [Candidatus Obscuribacter sp.]